jgi:hypothetical protein
VREAEPEGDIGVRLAYDMRNAEFIAPDPHMITGGPGDKHGRIWRAGLREPVGNYDGCHGGKKNDNDRKNRDSNDTHIPSPNDVGAYNPVRDTYDRKAEKGTACSLIGNP